MRKAFPSKEEKKNGIVKLYSSRCCDKYSTLKKGRFFETSYWKLGVKKIKALANQLAEVWRCSRVVKQSLSNWDIFITRISQTLKLSIESKTLTWAWLSILLSKINRCSRTILILYFQRLKVKCPTHWGGWPTLLEAGCLAFHGGNQWEETPTNDRFISTCAQSRTLFSTSVGLGQLKEHLWNQNQMR